jgi:alpha,alpha-trehalase
VYGEILDAAFRLQEYVEDFDPLTLQLLADIPTAAAARWTEKDHGIWEVRGPPKHFLHSKLMCWVALDRGIRMAALLDAQDRVEGWEATRDEIREAILERGWSERVGAFTQIFDDEALDASSLLLATTGFLDARDPRMVATLKATEDHLTDQNGLVYRYRTPDGLDDQEGTFLLCTFWLAEAWALAGETKKAREVFQRAIDCANDLGLLAEEVDPGSRTLRGNFPQAFSHIGLVNAAWAIHQAEEGLREGAAVPEGGEEDS